MPAPRIPHPRAGRTLWLLPPAPPSSYQGSFRATISISPLGDMTDWLAALPQASINHRLDQKSQNHDSVYRFIGVWQQESGKGPRLANGAVNCIPDLT